MFLYEKIIKINKKKHIMYVFDQETAEPKWVNPISNIIEVNSLRVGDPQITYINHNKKMIDINETKKE